MVIVIAVCVTALGGIAFWKAKKDRRKHSAFSFKEQALFSLITVMSIIAAGSFLALIGKVNSEGIISLLSGIAGYVLGRYARGDRRPGEAGQRNSN